MEYDTLEAEVTIIKYGKTKLSLNITCDLYENSQSEFVEIINFEDN